MENKNYIPALRFNWLTKLYNPLIAFTMPELKFKTALIQQATIQDKHTVLDFGVGTATLALLTKQHYPNATIIGVDVDEKILQIASKKIQQQNVEVTLTKYYGFTLPYPDNHFDRVVSSLVFHHLDKAQKQKSLSEIYRVLKPNGELHIADWGKANNMIVRLAFYLVQFLDGFKTTNDNIKGLLPKYIEQSEFKNVQLTKSYNTVFGTLWLHKSVKTNN